MCNSLHPYSKKIPRKGKGYKLFSIDRHTGQYASLVHQDTYDSDVDTAIVWYENSPEMAKQGFGFFLSKTEALRALSSWQKAVGRVGESCRKIQYYGGLGCHSESNFMYGESFKIALCKKFKISEGEVR